MTDQTPRTEACPVCGELHATDMVAHIIAHHPYEAPRILHVEPLGPGYDEDAPCSCGHPDDTHYQYEGCLRCERYMKNHDEAHR